MFEIIRVKINTICFKSAIEVFLHPFFYFAFLLNYLGFATLIFIFHSLRSLTSSSHAFVIYISFSIKLPLFRFFPSPIPVSYTFLTTLYVSVSLLFKTYLNHLNHLLFSLILSVIESNHFTHHLISATLILCSNFPSIVWHWSVHHCRPYLLSYTIYFVAWLEFSESSLLFVHSHLIMCMITQNYYSSIE